MMMMMMMDGFGWWMLRDSADLKDWFGYLLKDGWEERKDMRVMSCEVNVTIHVHSTGFFVKGARFSQENVKGNQPWSNCCVAGFCLD